MSLVLITILIFLALSVGAIYNRLVRLKNQADESWSGIDVQLKRRYDLIPKLYISPYISTLPVFKTLGRCMEYLASDLPAFSEGLVFRAAASRGFADHTIVRCRRLPP